jgi:chemotaxis protein MotA
MNPSAKRPASRNHRLDLTTAGGLVLAISAILGGLLLEGGSVMDVAQITAALIVVGGTLGAVMIACPTEACVGAVQKLRFVLFRGGLDSRDQLAQLLMYAGRARKGGIVSLEGELDGIENPFLQKALMLAVDGTDIKDIREIMQIEMEVSEQEDVSHARVFEAAGGYAPTVGIIGAVLGLIQVMKHLENIDEVGKGIAVAFVATVYGVGSANLFFLPAAAKVRARLREEWKTNEMLLEGVCSIVEGMNPRMIARKLEPFVRKGAARRATTVKAMQSVGSTSADLSTTALT